MSSSHTLLLGLNDRVIVSDETGLTVSGRVFSIDHAPQCGSQPHGPFEYHVYVSFDTPEDYKKITRHEKGWPIYCSNPVGKMVMGDHIDKDHFYIFNANSPHGIGGFPGYKKSYSDISAILISVRAYKITPVHQVDYAVKRYTIPLP
jgi:hypothetical protein